MKNRLIFILFVYILIFCGVVHSEDFNINGSNTIGLIGCWGLDETTARDDSINNSTAATSGVKATTTSVVGTALEFDGDDDYVRIGSDGEVEVITTFDVTTFTIMAWFKTDAKVAEDPIFSKMDGYTNNGYGLMWGWSGNANKLVWVYDGGNPVVIMENAACTIGTWYHVAITISDNSSMTSYVNGALNTAAQAVTHTNTKFSFAIGAGYGGLEKWFDGVIDNVKFYNRVLSLAEIKDIYDEEKPSF